MRKQGLIAAMLILAVWGSSLPSRFSKPPSQKHQGPSASGDRIWSLKALGDLLAKEESRQLAAGARDESLVSSWFSAHGAPSPSLFPLPLWSEGLPIEGRKPEKTPALTEHRATEASASESGSFLLARLHLSDAEALLKRMESLACSLGGPASTSPSSLSTGGGLAGAKSGLEGPRLHREALSAFSSGDWVSFRERTEELALLPSTQDASLYLEHLDGLGALITGRAERAVELFSALSSDLTLPPGMSREVIEDSLERAQQALVAKTAGEGQAVRSLSLLDALVSSGTQEAEVPWSVQAEAWCARAARRYFLCEAANPADEEELAQMAERFPQENAGACSRENLEAFVDLVSWASLELILEERRGDLDGVSRWADRMEGLLKTCRRVEGRATSCPTIALRKAAELFEERGRSRLLRADPRARVDLLEAGRRYLSLAGALEPLPDRTEDFTGLCERSARMFQLAGDDSAAIAVLSSLRSARSSDASLSLSRSYLAEGKLGEALLVLDSILDDKEPKSSRTEALGPLNEEARLLRGLARLERSLSTPEAESERLSGPRAVFDRLAEEDFLFCLENLSPLSWVSRAALYYRGLQVELRALGEKGDTAEGTALFQAAMDSFQRALTVEEARASSGEDGRVSRAWRILLLDRLGGIGEKLGRKDFASRCLEGIIALDSDGEPLDWPRGQGAESDRSFVFFPRGIIRELTATAEYRLGDLALRSGEVEKALASFERALRLHGENLLAPWAHIQIATIFRWKGNPRRSIEELEAARLRLGEVRSQKEANFAPFGAKRADALAQPLFARWEEACKARISELLEGACFLKG